MILIWALSSSQATSGGICPTGSPPRSVGALGSLQKEGSALLHGSCSAKGGLPGHCRRVPVDWRGQTDPVLDTE